MMALFKRRHLYVVAALLWGVPGVLLTIKGVSAYGALPLVRQWWLLLVTALVIAGFLFMFGRIVERYTQRIALLPAEKNSFWETFPRRGWWLMAFMMGLGAVMRLVPVLPVGFVAAFYSGLGPVLLLSAVRFALRARSQTKKTL